MTAPRLPTSRRTGFTLIELLIVVVILAILSTLAFAQVLDLRGAAREARAVTTLQMLRRTIERYHVEHEGRYPGRDARAQLTGITDGSGRPRPPDWPGRRYGPYLRNGLPANPLTGSSVLRVVDILPIRPSDQGGWIYAQLQGELRLDMLGSSEQGVPYYQL